MLYLEPSVLPSWFSPGPTSQDWLLREAEYNTVLQTSQTYLMKGCCLTDKLLKNLTTQNMCPKAVYMKLLDHNSLRCLQC